jgi:hypothetical protein
MFSHTRASGASRQDDVELIDREQNGPHDRRNTERLAQMRRVPDDTDCRGRRQGLAARDERLDWRTALVLLTLSPPEGRAYHRLLRGGLPVLRGPPFSRQAFSAASRFSTLWSLVSILEMSLRNPRALICPAFLPAAAAWGPHPVGP